MILLYSINTWLAYKISENYYHDKHYVWCSPVFNAKDHNPPSSDPYEIFNGLMKDVKRQDAHSSKIITNRTGIINGATEKKKQGIISEEQYIEIVDIANSASIEYFRPIIYVIPFSKVEHYLKPASIKIKASIFSKEYILEELKRVDFDVIDISETL